MDLITDNIGTIIICVLLAAAVIAVIRYLIRNSRRGKSSCGCSCGSCPMAGTCSRKEES